MKNIQQIRAAILANRGGFKDASDTEILTVWQSLDEQTQKQYLESIKERKTNAVGTKS